MKHKSGNENKGEEKCNAIMNFFNKAKLNLY